MKYSSRNLYALSLVFLFSVFTNTGLAESLSEQLDECKIIKVSLIRLQCYDRISNQTNKKTAVKTKKRLFNLGRSQKKESEVKNTNPVKEPKDIEPDDKQNDPSLEEGFGQPKDLNEPDEINTNIKGVFNGWSGKTEFVLQNGQVWKQSSNGMLTAKLDNPKVRIRKGMLGSYILTVEGFNSSIKVKRIQ